MIMTDNSVLGLHCVMCKCNTCDVFQPKMLAVSRILTVFYLSW